jgi:hypothetical protein
VASWSFPALRQILSVEATAAAQMPVTVEVSSRRIAGSIPVFGVVWQYHH